MRIGRILGELAQPGDVFALTGDLGAGKTTLAQAIAQGVQVTEPVSSPTFALIREYDGRLPVYHMDVYRLGNRAIEEDLGFEDYFYGDGLCIVEWAELVLPLLPADVLFIRLSAGAGSGASCGRELLAYGTGTRSERLVKEWETRCLI
ncbi:MAG: tRNA ((37)-N6)-threonylcarbamoyltransferase complex ATPase subunit type 1 TsaE [Bacilli bacterium]|nr:tRNA ((37)-N6)-threonylcarbamoyltransferase complex ATPase subunit type 1 TsaE [Bacilli bacterium]